MGGITESDTGHVFSSGNWESLPTIPGAIESTAMAYSPDNLKIVMYGGRSASGTLVNQLWVYDITSATWTQKTNWNCAPCPTARAVHSIAYDNNKNKFIIFGGYHVGGHSFETNETWTYDLATNTWTKLNFGSQDIPARRHWGSLEYNPDQKMTYLFGGHFNNGGCPGDIMYNDVWKLDITGTNPKWTNMNPSSDPTNGKPIPRQSDWIYNPVDKKFYVFGGKRELGPATGTPCGTGADNRETLYNDLWKYDPAANQWTRVQSGKTDYTHYPLERRADIVYDDSTNSMLFFSGLKDNDFVYGSDTWLYDFDNSKWSTVQDTDGTLPPIRLRTAAAWDDSNNIMYIYGINENTKAANFWKLKIAKNNISISCFDTQPVIFGTDANNPSIVGNDAINVIAGLFGDDTIRGDLAGDFLCGGKGNDKIYGESGNDKLYGFEGNDEIHGGSGNDNLRGGAGNDKLYGETGKDSFECGSGTDTIVDFSASQGDTKTGDCENF